jgi:hypothetical protein
MSTATTDDMLQALKQPFPPAQVTWKPGSVTKDQTRALALAYADLRAYQNRLDAVCGADWRVTYTPCDKRLICHLTIGGVTRSSTGEPDSREERAEMAGTAAEAQAFKRACSMFNLGRYLYTLPSVWVDYDAQTKQFTAQAKAHLAAIIAQHYRRTLELPAEPGEDVTFMASEPAAAAPTTPDPANDKGLAGLRKRFEKLGRALYGEQWAQVSQHNAARITDGQTTDPAALTAAQLQKLIKGLQQVKRTRRSPQTAEQQAHVTADDDTTQDKF